MVGKWQREAKAAQVPMQYRQRVTERLAVLEYASEYGAVSASLRFGLSEKTVRRWRARRAEGVRGLIPRYPARRRRRIPPEIVELITFAREHLNYGSTRTALWLLRAHRIRVSQTTIQRIVRDLALPALRRRTRKRRPRQLRLFERERPGECVQVDVKFVRIGGQRRFQYTAIDDCTRYRVLRLYRTLNQWSSLAFLDELVRAMPFRIQQIQTDNGPEFPLAFKFAVERAGIAYRYIQPRRPQQNGKVERSHRIDNEEFWGLRGFGTFADATSALAAWERVYNHDRFSMALKGRTPAERLADFRNAA